MRLSVPLSLPAMASVLTPTLLAAPPPLVHLEPQAFFSLTETLAQTPWSNMLLQEIRADNDTLWVLLTSRERSQPAIVAVDFAGRLRALIDLSPGQQSSGLFVLTSRGLATIVADQKKPFLREYDRRGNLVSERALPCVTHLIAIAGTPCTICPDGTITTYPAADSPRRWASWARPGTLVEFLAPNHLAILDPTTAQSLITDLRSGGISVVTIRSPEIGEALQMNANRAREAAKAASPETPPLGSLLVTLDTAADAAAWYMLIYPYHPTIGPSVAKLDRAGVLTGRFRLRLPPSTSKASWHRIERAKDLLILASTRGDIALYPLKSGG